MSEQPVIRRKENPVDKYVVQYAHLVLKWRFLVILACLSIVAAASYGLKDLYFDSDYRIFFEPGNQHLINFERVQKSYSRSDNVLMLVIPESEDVFNSSTLKLVSELTEESWKLPFSQRVDSISNFQHTFSDEDSMMVESLIEDPNNLTADKLKHIKEVALNESQLLNKLITKKSNVTAINVVFFMPGEDDSEFQAIGKATSKLAEKYKVLYPGNDIKITGMITANYTMQNVVIGDGKSLIPLMWLIIFLTLYLMLRSVSAVFTTFLIIVFSVLSALGFMGWIGLYLSGPSSSIPIIIVTMAVADCVHLLVSYFHQLNAGKAKHPAIVESLRINFGPIFVTSLTTTIGFLSMNFSDVPPFKHLGNIVAVGIFFAFFFSITFLPAFMSLLPAKGKKEGMRASKLTSWISDKVIVHQNALFWGTLLLGFFAAFAVNKNEINDQFIEYFDKSLDFRQASDFASDHLSGLSTLEIELEDTSGKGVSSVEFLKALDKFQQWLYEQPEVLHVGTLTDTVKNLNRSMHGDDEQYYKIPDSTELAAQYLLLYEMSLPYGLDLTNQVNFDKTATRVTINMTGQKTMEMLAFEKRILNWLEHNVEDMNYFTTGQNIMFSHIGVTNAISMIKGTMLALFIISIILILMLRSLRYGMISLAPNLVPAIFSFALWGALVGEVGLSIAISIGMTLGIVVDSTVHFLSKYVRARREENFNTEEAVRYAFSNVGVALLVTNMVLIAGFIVLAQSNLRLNSDMGIFTAMTFFIALTVDFLFLPALLLKTDKRKKLKPLATETSLSVDKEIQHPVGQ